MARVMMTTVGKCLYEEKIRIKLEQSDNKKKIEIDIVTFDFTPEKEQLERMKGRN